jgi:hypothetical protein
VKFWRLGWETDPPVERMRRFYLVRTTDVSGVSGTGRVVAGVQFADGTVVMRWLTEHRSTVVWSDLASALTVHGHDGATVIEWVDG